MKFRNALTIFGAVAIIASSTACSAARVVAPSGLQAEGRTEPDSPPFPIPWRDFQPRPASSSEDPGFYPELVRAVRESSSSRQENTLRSVIRFLNPENGYLMSTIVEGGSGFRATKKDPSRYVAFLTGIDGETLTVFVPKFDPGTYSCAPGGFAIGFSFTGDLPTAGKTAWSDVGEGRCSFEITLGPKDGDVEARFSGQIVSNDRESSYTVDSGYIFVRRGP
jgi:hypothetical protein